MNPLAPRILLLLGVTKNQELDFNAFVRFLSIFHPKTPMPEKAERKFFPSTSASSLTTGVILNSFKGTINYVTKFRISPTQFENPMKLSRFTDELEMFKTTPLHKHIQ